MLKTWENPSFPVLMPPRPGGYLDYACYPPLARPQDCWLAEIAAWPSGGSPGQRYPAAVGDFIPDNHDVQQLATVVGQGGAGPSHQERLTALGVPRIDKYL